ncbi:MAG: hypothetical protein ACXWTP_06385 [Methylosarcina sp.]
MKDTTPQAVQACHELLRWLIPHLNKFPLVRRFACFAGSQDPVWDGINDIFSHLSNLIVSFES